MYFPLSGNNLQYTPAHIRQNLCLLYTSDAADEEDSVDLGGRRIIKKKKNNKKKKKEREETAEGNKNNEYLMRKGAREN